MELIDKDKVIAEIERLQSCTMDKNMNFYSEAAEGEYHALSNFESFLNTLEVKEVDLEKEIKSWLDHGHITDTRYDDYDDDDIERTAKHFYELGLKAKRE